MIGLIGNRFYCYWNEITGMKLSRLRILTDQRRNYRSRETRISPEIQRDIKSNTASLNRSKQKLT